MSKTQANVLHIFSKKTQKPTFLRTGNGKPKKKHFYIITIEVHNLKLCFKKLFNETGQIKSC